MKLKITLLFLWGLLLGCTNDTKPDRLLAEAHATHLKSVEIQEKVKIQLDSLRKLPDFKAKADSLSKVLEEWESALLEVEGFEHEHKHNEHHAHKHTVAPKMSNEQTLEYQQNTKKAIEELRLAVDKLTKLK